MIGRRIGRNDDRRRKKERGVGVGAGHGFCRGQREWGKQEVIRGVKYLAFSTLRRREEGEGGGLM